MLVDVIKYDKTICLGLDYPPSVRVGVSDKPGRRFGVEITTQDYVGCVNDVL